MQERREPLLILARHSSPHIIPELRASEWRLSDEGRRRAQLLGRRLTEYAPDVIVSSVEPKAIETARIAAAVLGVPSEIAEGIHEHRRTRVPHLAREDFQASVERLFCEPDRAVFGDETAVAARRRAEESIARIVEAHPDARVAIVTHGTVLALVVAEANALDAFALWKKLAMPSFAVLRLPAIRLIRLVETVVEEDSACAPSQL